MKTLEYYMSLRYPVLIEDGENGGFVVSYPDLQGCLSVGDTLEEAIRMGEDARRAWTEAALEDGFSIPEPKRIEDCPDNYKMHLPRSLYRLLATNAAREGVSMNQYCVYLLSLGVSA